MLELIRKLRARWKWNYVATFRAVGHYVDGSGNLTGRREEFTYVLSERGNGQRRVTPCGGDGPPSLRRKALALALVWKRGGPLPQKGQWEGWTDAQA